MAARKLQNEIDKTLKKVTEGCELFDEIYDKMMSTTHQAQKEKLETDLKTQIKKLQRLRDQIKTWIASSEIKDKTALTDNRRQIETQMERFKACEKEIKTKAFSKEGLSAQARLDPHEKLKLDTSNWLGSQVEELGRQMETTDAEVESLVGTTKKKKSGAAGSNRMAELEALNERRKWHIGRLELMMRLIENGNLDPDNINSIKEDIAYFVESNAEEDFEEDVGLYDELNLDAEEEAFGIVNEEHQSSHDSQSLADTSDIVTNATPSKPATAKDKATPAPTKPKKDESAASSEGDQVQAGEKSPPSARVAPSKSSQRKATLESQSKAPATTKAAPAPIVTTTTVSSPAASAPQPRQAPVVLPPIRYSAAAAAAVAPPTTTQSSSATTVTSPPPTTAATSTPGVLPTHSANVKVLPAQPPKPAEPAGPPPGIDATARRPSVPPASGPSPSPSSASLVSSLQNQQASSDGASVETSAPTPSQALSPDKLDQNALLPDEPLLHGQQPSAVHDSAPVPNSLSDLVSSFDRAKERSAKSESGDLTAVSKMLDAGYSNVPQPIDAEKPRYYVPKQPFATAPWYPQQPLTALEQPSLDSKYEVDTLFYIFYYQVGTYQQYLAAEELKKRAWRFHKQYLTWFQRAHEPQNITEEYEQGVYLYFDWETAWSTRKKNSFTFHYKWLEDE